MTANLRELADRARLWYSTLPDPVKAAAVAAWVVFTARMAAPTFVLWDDVMLWLEGSGPAPDFVTWSRLARAAGTAALGAFVNYVFRLKFPGPRYESRKFPPPNVDDRPVAGPTPFPTTTREV